MNHDPNGIVAETYAEIRAALVQALIRLGLGLAVDIILNICWGLTTEGATFWTLLMLTNLAFLAWILLVYYWQNTRGNRAIDRLRNSYIKDLP